MTILYNEYFPSFGIGQVTKVKHILSVEWGLHMHSKMSQFYLQIREFVSPCPIEANTKKKPETNTQQSEHAMVRTRAVLLLQQGLAVLSVAVHCH
jgi:hypothetical protein